MLIQRSNTYYYRWQIPGDIRFITLQHELIRSLHTSDKAIALERSLDLCKAVSKIKTTRKIYKLGNITYQELSNTIEGVWDNLTCGALSSNKALRPDRNTLVSAAWKAYREDKLLSKKWTNPKMIKERDGQLNDFIELLGSDLPLKAVTRQTARNITEAYQLYPAHRTRRYGDMPLTEIPKESPKVSINTVSQTITNLTGLFSWLEREEYTNSNPFKGINVKAEKKSYATYSEEDISELFNLTSALTRKNWQCWIPRVALFTGARQNEIAQLLVTDVIQDKPTGIWYLSINDREPKEGKI